MQPALGAAQPAEDPEKGDQIKKMAAVLAGMIPPAARVSLEWADRLYEHGLRFHPEFAEKPPLQTETQKAFTPDVQTAARERALDVLRQMADQFPFLRPTLEKVETAKTPEELAAALQEMSANTQPDVLGAAMEQAGKLGDNTE